MPHELLHPSAFVVALALVVFLLCSLVLRGFWGRFNLWRTRNRPVIAPRYLDAELPL